jgi:hypothetical protein
MLKFHFCCDLLCNPVALSGSTDSIDLKSTFSVPFSFVYSPSSLETDETSIALREAPAIHTVNALPAHLKKIQIMQLFGFSIPILFLTVLRSIAW